MGNAGFACGIDPSPRLHHLRQDGRDIDDFTLFPLYHLPANKLAAEEKAPQVGIEDGIPFIFLEVLKWFSYHHGGVIDQDINLFIFVHHLSYHGGNGGLLADIGGYGYDGESLFL